MLDKSGQSAVENLLGKLMWHPKVTNSQQKCYLGGFRRRNTEKLSFLNFLIGRR